MQKILLIDDLNISKRNYASLYEAIKDDYDVFCSKNNRLLKLNNLLIDNFKTPLTDSFKGPFLIDIKNSMDWLINGSLSIGRLSIPTKEICSRMIRQYLVVYDQELAYRLKPLSYNEQVEFLNKHPIALKNLIKMLEYWEEYFNNNLHKIKNAKAVIVFGGVNILPSIMLAVCKRLGISTLVSEHFVTGVDSFLEFRYSPIPNNSYARRLYDDEVKYDINSINKTIGKFNLNKNKNAVRKVDYDSNVNIKGRYLVIVAQVPDDASMSLSETFFSPTAKLIESIDWLLNNTDYKLAIKWHPWEHVKLVDESYISKDKVTKHFIGNKAFSKRVIYYDECNLIQLCENAHATLTICSQSAIEIALFAGKKTITLIQTYYNFMGITSCYDSVADVDWNKWDDTLSLDEYNRFLNSLTWFVLDYLYCVFPSGINRIKELLSKVKSNSLPGSFEYRVKIVKPNVVNNQSKLIAEPGPVTREEFERLLIKDPSKIKIPDKYKTARYLQNKSWAKPLWLLAVPLSRLNRILK